MTAPPFLIKGDKIAIVSTARKITKEEVQPAVQTIESWGIEVVLGNNLFKEHHQLAGTDEDRLADFQEALDDASVKAILCVRGGYGTVRIVDRIDFSGFIQNPKWIAGYSDITALHSHIHTNFGIQTLHSIMPVNFPENGKGNEATETLRKALFGEPLSYTFNPHPFNRKGSSNGIVVGGNLSMLYSLTGTNSDIDTKGKILFMEDLDEYLYHVDRMMMNLKKGGKLDQLAGLVIGGMTDMNDNPVPFGKTAEEIIAEHIAPYDYPVAFDFPAGHIEHNYTLYIGRKASLEVNSTSKLAFL